ncbi:MAG: hypothetical protein RBS40_10255 [Rhodocyclaceae bacterium]|nr:hypothetical protein [Rhodocyclaceae bacterium]
MATLISCPASPGAARKRGFLPVKGAVGMAALILAVAVGLLAKPFEARQEGGVMAEEGRSGSTALMIFLHRGDGSHFAMGGRQP